MNIRSSITDFVYSMILKCCINMDQNLRIKFINITVFFMVLFTWLSRSIITIPGNVLYFASFLLTFTLVILANDGTFGEIKIDRCYFVLFILFLLSFLIAALAEARLGTIMQVVVYLIAFPLISIMINTEDKQIMIINSFFNSVIINFYMIWILSVLLTDAHHQPQYSGFIDNPNSFAIFGTTVFIGCIYKIYNGSKFGWLGLGICCMLIFIIQSRTALLCVIVNAIIIFIFSIKYRLYRIVTIKRIVIAILGAVIVWISVFSLSPISQKLHDYVLSRSNYSTEVWNEIELKDRDFYRLKQGIGDNYDFSTGRKVIWEAYIKEINLLPHGDNEYPQVENKNLELSAHNTYIHLAYCFGFFSGILYLLFNLYTGFLSTKLLFNKKMPKRISVILFMVVLDYGIVTLVETVYSSLNMTICLSYWLLSYAVLFSDVYRKE